MQVSMRCHPRRKKTNSEEFPETPARSADDESPPLPTCVAVESRFEVEATGDRSSLGTSLTIFSRAAALYKIRLEKLVGSPGVSRAEQ